MSTAPNAIVESLFKSMNSLNISPNASYNRTLAEMRATGDRILYISSALQTSLELEEVLGIFMRETTDIIGYDSIGYSNSTFDIDFTLGKKSLHSFTYGLDLAQHALGDITFSRRRRFVEDELKVIEQLLCVLIYPLRNALMYQQAVKAATKDALTGLYNRAAMDDSLERELKLAKRHGAPISLIVLDIDHFKRINDSLGHACGDIAIKALANILHKTARASDLLFRYGGEEFVMVLPNTDITGASLLAERLRQIVEAHQCTCLEGETLSMTVSLGVCEAHTDDGAHSLFLRADEALYASKQGGRNRTTIID